MRHNPCDPPMHTPRSVERHTLTTKLIEGESRSPASKTDQSESRSARQIQPGRSSETPPQGETWRTIDVHLSSYATSTDAIRLKKRHETHHTESSVVRHRPRLIVWNHHRLHRWHGSHRIHVSVSGSWYALHTLLEHVRNAVPVHVNTSDLLHGHSLRVARGRGRTIRV